jgi:subtilisin family serine protease
MDYPQDALDGNTALISRIARTASEKGILLFCSAGNEGNGRWEKITFPSDAPGILTVGSITSDKKRSVFSSVGFTSDYRVKPDIVALGTGCCVVDPSGNIRYANGTSFATPILAGLGVCLWQALPWLNNTELIELLQESSSQYKHPDAELGYGIPDVYKAYKKETTHVSLSR